MYLVKKTDGKEDLFRPGLSFKYVRGHAVRGPVIRFLNRLPGHRKMTVM